MFEYALAAGLTASGADAYLLHVTSTPSVSYVARTEDFDCGIMISASHNPFYDNGIKIINGNGYKLEAEVENLIEEYLDKEVDDIPLATGEAIGRTVDYVLGRNRYLGYLISLPTKSFKDVKVGIDCANGSAHQIATAVFNALGAKTFVINAEPDGVNINTDCGSTHIEKLQEFVKENRLDIGFAYDGDADRCLAVDENGKLIDGDAILYICGNYLKNKGELNSNKVVTTVMSNLGLYKAFDELGIGYEKTDVGDKYVSENMVANDYSLGGEQSGHIIFSKYATTGDGVLTSLKLMDAMIDSKRKISELAEGFKVYPQLLVNLKVSDKELVMNDVKVLKTKDEVEAELNGNGRVLLRKSGTEPLIRVMAEAETDEKCREAVEKIVDTIRAAGYIS